MGRSLPLHSVLVLVLLLALPLLTTASFYDVLGVEATADAKQIRQGYRQQALKYHPDKNSAPDAKERFVQIGEAYETLSDATRRRQYDALGGDVARSAGGGGGGGGGRRRRGGFSFEDAAALFNGAFGEELWQSWEAGGTVTGVITHAGEKLTITIHPGAQREEMKRRRREEQEKKREREKRR